MYAHNGEVFDFVNISNTYFWLDSTNNMGVKNLVQEIDFKLYPNPSSGKINVEIPNDLKIARLEICDLIGRIVHVENNISKKKIEFDLGNITKGIYFVNLIDSNGMSCAKRVVKQ